MLNNLDNFHPMREALRQIADENGFWAGLPMPLDGKRLVIEKNFPHGDILREMGMASDAGREALEQERLLDKECEGVTERNTFWSFNRKAWVLVYQGKDGKVRHCLDHGYDRGMRLFESMFCSSAWGIEQESRAVNMLGNLLNHHHFKSYLLTGMFMETSKRTGLCYIFRRLRPTVVLDMKHPDGDVRIKCALCMHPVGYYARTWAGVMCPTDEVIAHLTMMRGDEPMYWRRANQHPPWSPLAGI